MKSRLKVGDIIIALEDLIIPSTGCSYYIYKGFYYKIVEYLPAWTENAWHIELIMNRQERRERHRKEPRNRRYDPYMTESQLFEQFDCVKIQRKEKLKKLNLL